FSAGLHELKFQFSGKLQISEQPFPGFSSVSSVVNIPLFSWFPVLKFSIIFPIAPGFSLSTWPLFLLSTPAKRTLFTISDFVNRNCEIRLEHGGKMQFLN
ncbi:MAG: hypothetical protein WCI51_05920, partial [Lentisphaerota bacterium]